MGRNWVVTGGSRGIGRAVVDRALAGGDTVHVLARTVDRDSWPAGVRDRVRPVAVDVADPDSVERAVTAVEQDSGAVDALVQAAGVHRGGRLERLGDEAWQEVIGTNLTGAFRVARAVRRLLVDGSSVVNVGAVVGLRGFPGDAAYGSAKAGLSGLTSTLAVELAPQGVRVNLVVPGFVDTEMTAGIPPAARQAIVDGIPMGRVGRAEEIAEVICAVAGASYMTGSTVAVDGGLLASFGAPRPRSRAAG
ncbi:SDR family oxidoreductase [Actinomycetospora sp. CA-084318]|uniref:SDR family oxidoreductase n=1 Tax=Actinomycetospora sp. CA-084318 TaxID=3239892 RepID=UPI003D985744